MVLLTFTAPNRPLSENESRRLHWAQRRRRLEDWKISTTAAWRVADPEDKATLLGKRISVRMQLPFARNGRRDPHNYVGTNVKACVDALTGLAWVDDTTEFVLVHEPELKVDKSDEVRILLEPIGDLK